MGYHFGITPTLLVNEGDLEIRITLGAYGLLHGKEICLKVRNSKPRDKIVGLVKMFWIDMYFPFTNHSFEREISIRVGKFEFCCGKTRNINKKWPKE